MLDPEGYLLRLESEHALSALLNAGISSPPADWITSGCVYMFDGELVVFGCIDDPVLGSRDLYIPAAAPQFSASITELDRLVDLIRGRLPGIARALFRCEPEPACLDKPGAWRPYVSYFSKVAQAIDGSFTQIAPAVNSTDWEFVETALRDALYRGYLVSGYVLDSERAAEHQQVGVDMSDPMLRVAVALEWDEPVGHVTWIVDSLDEVSGNHFDEIVDVSVVEQAAGRQIGSSLLAWVERAAEKRGASLLGNVVAERNQPYRPVVTKNLLATGWRPHHDVLVRDS